MASRCVGPQKGHRCGPTSVPSWANRSWGFMQRVWSATRPQQDHGVPSRRPDARSKRDSRAGLKRPLSGNGTDRAYPGQASNLIPALVRRETPDMKSAIRDLLHRLGADLVRYPPPPEPPDPRSFTSRRGHWLKKFGVTVLLDVGANVGQYAAEVRQRGYRNRIVSFEPQAAAFAKVALAAGHDPRWQCLNLALGAAESSAEMNIAENSESSSLLPMERRHVTAYPESAYVGKESIRVTTLDSLRTELLLDSDVVWLKMDVQGYEMSVLDGASQTLPQVCAIEMELSVVSLYKGSALLCDSIAALEKRGYHLIAVEETFLDGQLLHALQLNGIFEQRSETPRGHRP